MEKIDVFFHDNVLKHDNGHGVVFQDPGFLDACGAKLGSASSLSVSRYHHLISFHFDSFGLSFHLISSHFDSFGLSFW